MENQYITQYINITLLSHLIISTFVNIITNQPSLRHPFNINNGTMVTSSSLPQYHTEGYAEGVGFNYGFVQNHGIDTDTEKYWHPS